MATPLKAFACHTSGDSEYVREVSAFLKRQFPVFLYEYFQGADQAFTATINEHLSASNVFLVFAGKTFDASQYCKDEVNIVLARPANRPQIVPVILHNDVLSTPYFEGGQLGPYDRVDAHTGENGLIKASACAREIISKLHDSHGVPVTWQAADDLPFNPHLFSYEKDIIRFYRRMMELGQTLYKKATDSEEELQRTADREKLADGCPPKWAVVNDLREVHLGGEFNNVHHQQDDVQTVFGDFRADDAEVGAAALRGFNTHKHKLNFPEAGPRMTLRYPLQGHLGNLRVAVLVSGGIAPGINAVIDGIVQRHYKYKEQYGHALSIIGYRNGFHGVLQGGPQYNLSPNHQPGNNLSIATCEIATLGGSVLGTKRMDDLINSRQRLATLGNIAAQFDNIDILYMIGGDGTMRAAHALWSVAAERKLQGFRDFQLSVVAIPKTMDNDILWVWQSFGFMSAVEKAREFIEHLYTEISSNPRLCVLQLFGSDSGFVISHAVLASAAGHCDLALIPEVKFSLLGIAQHLEEQINHRNEPIPRGLLVMAETAVPEDAIWYLDEAIIPEEYKAWFLEKTRTLPEELAQRHGDDITAVRKKLKSELTPDEIREILEFQKIREKGKRIQGQTNDYLRRAGLKMVMKGLEAILQRRPNRGVVQWQDLRMVANEPRHLVRAIPPSTSDIIMAQRLGTLAVDNAMAGYTDFMISQWLTEYVLVPLKLVVLGRKRIPESGVFWKSVLSKTHQPPDLVAPWPKDQ